MSSSALEIDRTAVEVWAPASRTYARSAATIVSSVLSLSSHPPPYANLLRSLPRKIRSVGSDPGISKIQASFTRTAEEPVREFINRAASTHPATSLEKLRSADTADLYTPGNPSFFFSIFPSLVTHQPHRDAVQQGHALPCVECRRQPQAIGDLCLGCNSTIGKSNEPRLRELDLQDPRADSRMLRTPAALPLSLTLF